MPTAPSSEPAYQAAQSSTLVGEASNACPIERVEPTELPARLEALRPVVEAQAATQGFAAKPGQVLVALGPDGRPLRVLAAASPAGLPGWRGLAARLPAGDYRLSQGEPDEVAATGWALGGYAFERYRPDPARPRARLVVADAEVRGRAERIAEACRLARDLVNTPPNDMGPPELEAAARALAARHGAAITVVEGEALLPAGYPAVHAVGRAAAAHRQPRFIEIAWRGEAAGDAASHLVIVGKGVVFDTGGLDIKPSAGMRNMKKDMGGAAHALALAEMVMGEGLPVRLTILLPVVENAIGGDAMRPGDVLATRAGLSVEVGNTDAEGRLILADALTRAGELEPDLTIDLATLTGAARVALGPDLPPYYTADDQLAAEVERAAVAAGDPLWRMPLWSGYEASLDSEVAELKNDPDAWAQAGSVTAALFLQRFAPKRGGWMHLDIFAWNPRKRPGFAPGGEVQAVRALFQLLRQRYGARA